MDKCTQCKERKAVFAADDGFFCDYACAYTALGEKTGIKFEQIRERHDELEGGFVYLIHQPGEYQIIRSSIDLTTERLILLLTKTDRGVFPMPACSVLSIKFPGEEKYQLVIED